MRFLPISVLLSITFALGTFAVPVSALTFTTNLTLGSTGADVINLQQTLVAQGYLVMPIGVSYGYFGPLTQSAVAKWQAVKGISPAVGYFGPISRSVMATQTSPTNPISTVPTPLPSVTPTPSVSLPSTDTPSLPGMRPNRIILFRTTPYEVRPGDAITLDGSGFSKTLNKVYFDGSYDVTATSTNGAVMKVIVPGGLSEGKHNLSVSNVLGTSNSDNPNIIISIKVTNNPQPAPIIESASIVGDTVTIVGSGFTSSNNIYTTFGSFPSTMSAVGDTITFNLTDLPMYNKIKQSTRSVKYQVALWINVKNEHGANKDPYRLNITI